jgi:hypothetical protein
MFQRGHRLAAGCKCRQAILQQASISRDPDSRRWKPCAVILVVIAATARMASAETTIDDLYQAQTIVTGQGEANRLLGFVPCLRDVLVKVSGDPRLDGDARVAQLAKDAKGFVTGFTYHDRMAGLPLHDEQGTRDRPYDLIVSFDPGKIDAELHSLGVTPWSATRPRLAVFLAMRNGLLTYLLDNDGDRGRDQRASLAAAASKRGVSIAVPGATAFAAAGLTFEQLPQTDLAQLDAVAKSLGGDAALAGRMVWADEPPGWRADWRIAWHGTTYRWQARSISFDEAFRAAMAGAAQILSGHGHPQ